jgi:hypothetical protein
MKLWFYAKTPNLTRRLEDGMMVTLWPYASKMLEMRPLTKVDPPAVVTPERGLPSFWLIATQEVRI